MPSLFPEPLQCTLGRNSSWSRSCPSLTVSGCTYTKASWVSTFQSEQPQSAQHFSFSFCSPVLDSVRQCGGQVILQGFHTELLQWAVFDSQEMESGHSSVVKRVCSFMPSLPGPSGTAQAKSRTSEFQSGAFSQLLAKVAGEGHSGWDFESFPVEQRGCTAPEQHNPSQFSCGIPLSKDFQAEAYQEQEKSIK